MIQSKHSPAGKKRFSWKKFLYFSAIWNFLKFTAGYRIWMLFAAKYPVAAGSVVAVAKPVTAPVGKFFAWVGGVTATGLEFVAATAA